jgi:hypothetical protein
VHERGAEVEVGAVGLVGELAQLRVALALGDAERVGGLVGLSAGALFSSAAAAALASGRRGCA